MPAGLINHNLLYTFTAGLVQGMITLLFFESFIETLQHWRIVSFDLKRDPGNCEFQMTAYISKASEENGWYLLVTLMCRVDNTFFCFTVIIPYGSIKVGILSFFPGTSIAIKCSSQESAMAKPFPVYFRNNCYKTPIFNRILYLSLN